MQPGKIEHDILVVRRNKQYFKIPAKQRNGTTVDTRNTVVPSRAERHEGYKAPKNVLSPHAGYREIVNLGLGENWHRSKDDGARLSRGPIISALPLHPDPAASAACTCYLFNPDNLTYVTSWTREEWSNRKFKPHSHSQNISDTFDLLVATAAGNVYLLSKSKENTCRIKATKINLRYEAELWNMLRNGCVAGSVLLVASPPGKPRVVPVVNIDSLLQESASREL